MQNLLEPILSILELLHFLFFNVNFYFSLSKHERIERNWRLFFFFWMSQALFTLLAILVLTIFSKDENIPIYAYLIGLVVISLLSFFTFSYFLKNKKGVIRFNR